MKNKKYYLFLIFVLVIAFSAILISCSNNETILFENNLNSPFLAEGTTLTEYQITYSGLDGATVDNNPTSYNEETETFTLNNPTKTGYTFLGWSGDDIVDKSTSVEIAKGSTGNKEYTANWEIITYTITYSGLENADSVTNPDSYNVNTETFTLNNPTKTGYNFLGWSVTGIDEKSTSVQIAKGSTGNREYTANWELTSYDITYIGIEGADNQTNPVTYTYESATIILQDPTKAGYTFLGWTTSDVTTPIKNLTIDQNSTGTKTFTANWQGISYTITYDVNKGDALDQDTKSVVYGDAVTLAVPTRTGYTFEGWYDGENKVSGVTWSIASDVTLKAKWKVITYTINYFDANGVNNKSTYDIETETFTLNEPTKTGYNFLGWSVTGIDDKLISVEIAKGSIGNREYTANWEAITYNVEYFFNGESLGEEYKQTYTIEDQDFSVRTLDKEHYRLINWKEDLTSENFVSTISTASCKNINLYANYVKVYNFTIAYSTYITEDSLSTSLNDKTFEEMASYIYDKVKDNLKGYTLKIINDRDNMITFATYYSEGDTSLNGLSDAAKNYNSDEDNWYEVSIYANKDINSYTIEYELDGGSLNIKKLVYNVKDNFTIGTPTKTGYDFLGWDDGKTESLISDIVAGTTGKLKLTAKWSPKTLTVSFDNANMTSTITVTYDSNYGSLPMPYIKGYTFDYWTLGDTTTRITSETIVKTAVDHTLNAHFKANEYSVKYKLYKGEEKTYKATYDSSITSNQENASLLIDPTREGYTFVKWVRNGEDFVVPITKWNISEDISIEAVWEANNYNVTLSVKDKEFKFNATYDSSISILTDEIKNYIGTDYITSFKDENGEFFADYTGVNKEYTYPKDITIYANFLFEGSEFTSNVNLDLTKLYDQINVNIDGKKITAIDNYNLNSIGNHKIQFLSSNSSELYTIDVVVKENIGLENDAHYKEVPEVNLNGQEVVSLKIDGKEYRYIEGNPNRLTKNGKHTIEITGSNGYTATYVVYFDNPNYTAFWYILGVTVILLIGVSIYSFLGRRNTIPYDYLDRR